jgi:putative membrane protein
MARVLPFAGQAMSTTPAPLDTGTTLAVERTRLAHERTLMAWVRTATSLISFGFTIYKFFQFEADRSPVAVESHLLTPRQFGMVMIGTGLMALLMATVDHRRYGQQLRTEYGIAPRSVSLSVSVVVLSMGVLAFAAALFRG